MAARDYANSSRKKAVPRRQTRRKQDKALPGWVWLLAGLSIGLAIAAGFYITRPTGLPTAEPAAAAGSQAEPKAQPKIELPPKEEARFSFYEILPNYEVVVPRSEPNQPAQRAPKTVPEPGNYLVQVGSFQSRQDADRQRATLALLGIESKIEKVTIDNRDTWYRVRVGPESDERRLTGILEQLAAEQIDALLIRVKN